MPARPATATALLKSRCIDSMIVLRSFGNRVQQIHRGEEPARTPERTEPLGEDGIDLAREIDLGQLAIDLQPEGRIVARKHERIGFERQILAEQREPLGALRLRRETDELD